MEGTRRTAGVLAVRSIRKLEAFDSSYLIQAQAPSLLSKAAAHMNRFVGVQEHCWRLSELLHELAAERPDVRSVQNGLSLSDAADWLDLASSVDQLSITTARYDESMMWCRGAAEHEKARSAALSEFAKFVTLFSFSWSAVEVLAQAVSWPQVPAHLRGNEKPGVIERLIYALYDVPPLNPYDELVTHLRRAVAARSPIIGFVPRPTKPFVGRSGEALNYIRQFRNAIAHGAAAKPNGLSPVTWQVGQTAEGHVALICTRLLLLSIQMAMLKKFGGEVLNRRPLSSGGECGAEAGPLLISLHLASF